MSTQIATKKKMYGKKMSKGKFQHVDTNIGRSLIGKTFNIFIQIANCTFVHVVNENTLPAVSELHEEENFML